MLLPVKKPLERRLAGVYDFGSKAFSLEVEPQPLGKVLLVFDDENALHDRAQALVALGSSSVNVLP